jgi:hypothetical protein
MINSGTIKLLAEDKMELYKNDSMIWLFWYNVKYANRDSLHSYRYNINYIVSTHRHIYTRRFLHGEK